MAKDAYDATEDLEILKAEMLEGLYSAVREIAARIVKEHMTNDEEQLIKFVGLRDAALRTMGMITTVTTPNYEDADASADNEHSAAEL
jgi:ribosome-binding ATPase YchF (GTP1/OBG family)